MKLLTDKELIWSAVVANTRMNRERNASGINSYEKELPFRPGDFLRDHIRRFGTVKWLDLCCGQGKALAQCAISLAEDGVQDRAALKGVDLVDGFYPVPPAVTCLQWEVRSAVDWYPDEKYDIITCVHGLHYVGDKLQVIQTACGALGEEGIFMANLDLKSIRFTNDTINRYLENLLIKNAIEYNVRKKIIVCRGTRNIDFGLVYQGANDQAGPNYTGQEAVDSYYIQPV
jgi:2-polyprenyl-3-methyl-5-hydroxy-6-metoxy-1,4-benzoquinol methylase